MNLDLYPARVSLPGKSISKARVIVDDHGARVYEEHRGSITLVAASSVETFERSERPRFKPHVITTADGEWQVTKGSGCGCGSKLKGMRVSELLNLEPA